MNKNDSQIMAEILKEHGFEQVQESASADIFVVNTCTVRAHAENRALSYIRGLQKWHEHGNRILAVVGCLAKDKADTISRRLDFVDVILGPDSYRKIGDYVVQVSETHTRIIDTELGDETYHGIYPQASHAAESVSIMRGCSNYCSYCIVPYARGRARSRNAEDILREVNHMVKSGVKDITLLGQNVNEYRDGNLDFAGLLDRLAECDGLFRLRFLTSHPKDFKLHTVAIIKNHSNICEWFHLPLQSGNNRILQLMNRQYTTEQYIASIDFIRQEIPHATITTDIIVGFPTETDTEFNDTIALLEKIRFDDAYMYRYSARSGTAASKLQSVDETTIKKRLSILIETQNRITTERTQGMIGKKYEILFEGRAKKYGSRGKTRGNKDVVVEALLPPGEVRDVIIKCLKGRTPIGEIMD
jgi:tRNA-2-methylthio-N6-dimethylallyladenosine synthase